MGKIIGAILGFLLTGGRLMGLFLGIWVGGYFDRGLSGPWSGAEQRGRRQTAFYTATFTVLGHLCKADGQVSPQEIRAVRAIMLQLSLSAEMQQLATRLFDEGKSPDFNLAGTIQQLRREVGHRPDIYLMFLEIQIMAVWADGELHDEEQRILVEICGLLQIPLQEFERLCAMIGGAYTQQDWATGANSATARAEAYKILGISDGASDREVKLAYRRLMNQHHPDKLISRGMPEEMVKVATERTTNIRHAYDQIREGRGMT